MNKTLAATLGLVAIGFALPASAADLAPRYTKAPALMPAMVSWAGPTIGIEGGGAFGHSNQTDPGITLANTADGHYDVSGALAGGTLGYNWQNGMYVYGLEGDYSWADITGKSTVCGSGNILLHTCGTKVDQLGTFRGRIGTAVGATGNWLLYATGGLAVGNVHAYDALFQVSGSEYRAGWTVGAGVETMFAPNWSAKLEYLYVDLGKAHLFDIVSGVPETVSFNANIVRAGITYHFMGPVIAKY